MSNTASGNAGVANATIIASAFGVDYASTVAANHGCGGVSGSVSRLHASQTKYYSGSEGTIGLST
jgi:hypothetical protein